MYAIHGANLGWAGKCANSATLPQARVLMHKSLISSIRVSLSHISVVLNDVKTCPSSSYIANVVG